MKIESIIGPLDLSPSGHKQLDELNELLKDLQEKPLLEEVVQEINLKIEKINSFEGNPATLSKLIGKTKSEIFDLLQKKMKMVPQNYYTSLWLSLGMTAFGLPIGLLIFAITGNIAFLAVGLPLGMGLGSFYGMTLDRKAAEAKKVILLPGKA